MGTVKSLLRLLCNPVAWRVTRVTMGFATMAMLGFVVAADHSTHNPTLAWSVIGAVGLAVAILSFPFQSVAVYAKIRSWARHRP
jgi:hypothetical protein